jgi:hypothetical protein
MPAVDTRPRESENENANEQAIRQANVTLLRCRVAGLQSHGRSERHGRGNFPTGMALLVLP